MQTEQKKINIDRKGYLLLLFEMYLSSILKQITFSSLLPFNLNQVKLCYFVRFGQVDIHANYDRRKIFSYNYFTLSSRLMIMK